jgi:hypothetical protein
MSVVVTDMNYCVIRLEKYFVECAVSSKNYASEDE